jgi:hypothetical protein
MPLQKQSLPINFVQGLDLKTDPLQVPFGRFIRLKNTIFQKVGRLQKRNGFAALPTLPDATTTFLTTFNGNLTAIGNTINILADGSQTWINKSLLYPIELETMPLVRVNTNQTQCDSAVSVNNLVCTAFTDVHNATTSYKYAIADSITGQNIVTPTTIANASGSPRVFVLGNYFVIVFTATVAGNPRLQYIAVNYYSLVATAATDISTQYTPVSTVAFDGFVANNNLYVAWNGSDGGGAIRVSRLDSILNQYSTVVFSGFAATLMSVCADLTTNTPNVYVTFSNGSTLRTLIVSDILVTVLSPTSLSPTGTILNVTSTANNGSVTVFYEVDNSYTYDTSLKTNFIRKVSMTQAGVVGSTTIIQRSVGLASKSFLVDQTIYMLQCYVSNYQPTYFLSDSSGNILAKLAYSNGDGYFVLGLPNASIFSNVIYLPYLIRTLIQPVNRSQGASNAGQGIYAQTGVNLVKFTLGVSNIASSEIANTLNLTGGFMWQYDGLQSVENNFFLWPDNIEVKGNSSTGNMTPQQYYYIALYEWADANGNIQRSAPSIPIPYTITTPVAFTGDTTLNSPIITDISSTALLQPGQSITATSHIPAGSYIVSVDSANQITISQNATSTQNNLALTATALKSLNIYVPTLRLTYKTLTAPKIIVYRWSTAQQIYYQVTSITSPTSSSKAVDSVTVADNQSDAQILGNSILYTTGGVVENISAPAPYTMTLYRQRLFIVDAENPNTLYYSKQVIENTPVEMSDLFTIYVAPTQGSQGSTGTIRVLAAMDDKLIIFKNNAIYYIIGNGPDNTGTNDDFSEPIFITSTVGCDNQQSVVFIPEGIMFQSDKGIWLLSRDMQTLYIGAPVEDFNSQTVLSSVNVPGTNQVRFTLDNGIVLMYDYFFKQWGTFEGVPAISSTLYQGLHTFVNQFGQVFQESPNTYLDGNTPVTMGFTTGQLNMAGLQGFERAYFFNFIGRYISPHKLQVRVAYNYGSDDQQSIINPTNYNGTYGDDPLYGSTFVYGGNPTLEQWRIFFQRQTTASFQISVDEIFDPQFGTVAGEGLTISGINVIYGIRGNYARLPASHSVG